MSATLEPLFRGPRYQPDARKFQQSRRQPKRLMPAQIIPLMHTLRCKYAFLPLPENAGTPQLAGLTQSEHPVSAAAEVLKNQHGKSTIAKRSVIVGGHKTSVSLEEPFWRELKSIAAERRVPLGDLISKIDAERQQTNLSSALRLFVLAKYRPKDADPGSPRP
jgi:predicted DNA-binding ribbon-helix-helix protein